MMEVCYALLCFVPQVASGNPKVFGFAEFIQALALLVVLYTIVDVRYKFRLAVTPGGIFPVTFGLITCIAVLTLVTDVWLAKNWWVPKVAWPWLDRAVWQGLLGGLFICAFFTWMYYAFIRPPIFGRRNAKRFANTLYRVVVKGDDAELAVIANELSRSASQLVKWSRRMTPTDERVGGVTEQKRKRWTSTEDYAHDLLLLLANRKLCRHIVRSSPVTALAIFQTMSEEEKYNIPVGPFAQLISSEAIADTDSIIYHEEDGFTSGLIGYLKPWTQTIYGNYALVDALGFQSPLDIDFRKQWSWDAQRWEAFTRAALVTIESFLQSRRGNISYVINRVFDDVKHACSDLYKLDGASGSFSDDDIYERLRVAVDFGVKVIEAIDNQANPPRTVLHRRQRHSGDIYDTLAEFFFDVLFNASAVKAPVDTCWGIQHNATWYSMFGLSTRTRAWRIVQFKLRRKLYDEVARMTNLPNYKGARILGLLLNVMGLKVSKGLDGYGRDHRALAKAILSWTEKHYLTMRENLPDVADAVLLGSITFDAESKAIVKTYLQGLRREAPRDVLFLQQGAA